MTVCDRGRGSKSTRRHTLNFFILHIKPEIESDASFSVLTDVYILREMSLVGL